MGIERDSGYNLLSTSNGVRLQAAVILSLVREYREAEPARHSFWLDHRDYFQAYLQATGVRPEDAPTFARIGHEHGEDHFVDFHEGSVIDRVERGGQPDLAINVKAGWQAIPGAPDSYTYEDTVADPPLRVTHERVSAYRVLVYGDIVVYDAIEGIHGRVTSGLLGLMFGLFGDGRAVSARFAISEDGMQVARTTARKGWFRKTQTATVYPEGRAEPGIPRDRPDLEAIEERLRTPLRIRYVPLDMEVMPPAPAEECE